jgi:3',5'-cyclic AMP phosphodiesterase CpdA
VARGEAIDVRGGFDAGRPRPQGTVMRLWAVSDLHVGYGVNAAALERLEARPDDWLIVAGDVGERPEHLRFAWEILGKRFARVLWTPGNHELWTVEKGGPRGEARYRMLVDVCREHGVLTPEDPWVVWPGEGGPHLIALVFTLYDYTFRPPYVPREDVIAWAAERGVLCADERRITPEPYRSMDEWCAARCALTEARLAEAAHGGVPLVIVGHFPLRHDLVFVPRIPRFTIWCGTTRTTHWATRFGARVVVSGHLHVRSTTEREGVRYEEVSLGYPDQWKAEGGLERYLRQILPAPAAPQERALPGSLPWSFDGA